MQVRGRYFVILWTLVFAATVGVIVRRNVRAYPVRQRIDAAYVRQRQLEAERGVLLRRVAGLEMREALVPKMQALGLRLATDTDVHTLKVPAH